MADETARRKKRKVDLVVLSDVHLGTYGCHARELVHYMKSIRPRTVVLNGDLIDSTDFLPTICDVVGATVPANVDGVSFLSQLRGERGTPREWLYMWYSPRQDRNLAVSECAFDQNYKLYRDGRFFDLTADPFEEKPLSQAGLSEAAAAGARQLQKVLDQFTNARPVELDRAFERSARNQPTSD